MKTQITAFEKELYQKSEILPELLKYQKEVAGTVMGAEFKDAHFSDIIKFFEKENEQYDGVLTDSLEKFKNDSRMIDNLIKAEISGSKGEAMTFGCLETLECNNRIVGNLELSNGTYTNEIDSVVITEKGIFIVEVKNTKKNIFIDKNGDYYRKGKYQKFDSNIADKMRIKETLLREKLSTIGYGSVKMFPVVVFTNKYIEVENKRRELKTCFLNQLPYIIEDCKSPEYLTIRDLEVMENALSEIVFSATFPLSFDTNAVKENFLNLMNDLECARNKSEPIKQEQNTESCIKSKLIKYVGMAASVAVISSLAFLKK